MTRYSLALIGLAVAACSTAAGGDGGDATGGSTAGAASGDDGGDDLSTTSGTATAPDPTGNGPDTTPDDTSDDTADGSTTSPPQPACMDDDDCAANQVCDLDTGSCLCDPTVAMCLQDVPSGHWVEIEGTAMQAVFPPARTVPGNPNAIIGAWGGGVFDRDRNRMVVWGGGHADYSGNEVYVFDLEALAWERLNDPSLDVGGDEATGYYPDGLPRSRHTYDYLVYIPELSAMCSTGGAGMWMSGQVNTDNFDCFDFTTLQWTAYAPAPEGTIAGIADYDSSTGRVAYVLGPQLRYLAQYDRVADAWTTHGNNFTNGGLGLQLTGRVHPTARLFVAVGGSSIYTWDLDAAGDITESAPTLANPPPDLSRANPGLDYSAALDRIVWWGGGGSLWSLDLDGATWEEHPVADDNAVLPPEPVANGTYGRFRYAVDHDVFVLVNEAAQNVFVRRL